MSLGGAATEEGEPRRSRKEYQAAQSYLSRFVFHRRLYPFVRIAADVPFSQLAMSRTYFGDLVRERRKTTGTTLGNVASKLGCSTSYLSDIEHGRRSPFGPTHMKLLAAALECPLEELWRASARDTRCVRFEDQRDEVLDVAASIAWFLTECEPQDLSHLRDFVANFVSRKSQSCAWPADTENDRAKEPGHSDRLASSQEQT